MADDPKLPAKTAEEVQATVDVIGELASLAAQIANLVARLHGK